MSTDLYQVRVLSVDGNRLTCQVTGLVPGSGDDLPASRTLALQFLWEPWLDRSHEVFHQLAGTDMTLEEAEGLWRSTPIGRELADRDICDGDWTRANVGRFIRHVEVYDYVEVQSESQEEVPQTQATYVITVTDSRWLEHMRPGMEWGTTAYDKDEKD